MYLHEAVKEAMKTNGLIYRKETVQNSDGVLQGAIRPTNTYDTCILVVLEDEKIKKSYRAWNPTADDLMADDWMLWDKFRDEVCNRDEAIFR